MPRTASRNKGWFRRGFDPRRHLLTEEERRRGGETWARTYCLCSVQSPMFHATKQDRRRLRLEDLARECGEDDRPGRPGRKPAQCSQT